jgi:exopolysaccharide biosynthesis polyprenyl glycosylphosphotransferase
VDETPSDVAAPGTGSGARPAGAPNVGGQAVRRAQSWLASYARLLVLADFLVVLAAVVAAEFVRFGEPASVTDTQTPYAVVGVAVVVVWLAALALSHAYEPRALGAGPDEFKYVLRATVRFGALLGCVAYAAKWDLARGYVAIALPLGAVALIAERYAARQLLHRFRGRTGRWMHRLVVLGAGEQLVDLIRGVRREPWAGYQVVGACVPARPDRSSGVDVDGEEVPVLGSLTSAVEAIKAADADAVAVAAGPGLTPTALRRLSWSLEGTGVTMLVNPGLTDVAGPRVSVRPVAGLPLLDVAEPELSGGRWLLKDTLELLAAGAVAAVLSPLLGLVALAVRLSSPGPALFRQTRVGWDGREFSVYKFRTMYGDAEARRAELSAGNEFAGGTLFKLHRDPRVTPLGRWLRRTSVDELPQLFNVLRGEMSLVGPRPPLPSEVATYEPYVHRRLLVKPGITGLWQISGRSDLSWDDSVRLDLYYVANWSLALDAMILWKTLFAVARGRGAY